MNNEYMLYFTSLICILFQPIYALYKELICYLIEVIMAQRLSYTIQPEWEEVEKARKECIAALSADGVSEQDRDAISMVLGELIENAVKYGSFSKEKSTISYSLDFSNGEVTIEVQSPVGDEDDNNFTLLDRTVQWIRGYQNPFEAYVKRLKEISANPLDDHSSGLGLVRIAYEGQSIVDFYVNANSIISVSAVYYLH